MESESKHNNELYEKMRQCENFVWLVCVAGITLPLIISVLVLEKTTHLLTIAGILTAITPTIFAFAALIDYHKAHKIHETESISNVDTQTKRGRRGDWLLYIGGILSILFVTVYIVLSGGVKGNLMSFYFVYIPSTTAVAFKTRIGLWLVSGMSFICLISLYYVFYDFGLSYECGTFSELYNRNEPDKIYYLGFSLLQIILIIILEHKTNKIIDINKEDL